MIKCILKKKIAQNVPMFMATLDNTKGFINLHFLQNVNCKKTVWDQARFSSMA